MRSLTTNGVDHDDVLAVLRSRDYTFEWRYDVLNRSLVKQDELTTVENHRIEMNVDRDIKGSLSLTMLPVSSMRNQLLKLRVRPVLIIDPGGMDLEFSEGVYVWVDPEEELELVLAAGIDPSEWDVTLFDLTHRLGLAGPSDGLTLSSGMLVTDAIATVLAELGITDTSGIVASTATLPTALTWDIESKFAGFVPTLADAGKKTDDPAKNRIRRKRRRKLRKKLGDVENQPVKYLDILQTLHDGIGYYSPHFDLDGVYQAKPQPDLTTAPAEVIYETGDGLLQRMRITRDDDRFANFVRMRTSGTGDFFGVATSSADDLVPGHPGSETELGERVDKIETNAVAASMTELQAACDALLLSSLSIYQSVSYSHLCNPAHVAFDVIAYGWAEHPEFQTPQKFHERRWTMDRNLEMTGDARRLIEVS